MDEELMYKTDNATDSIWFVIILKCSEKEKSHEMLNFNYQYLTEEYSM